MPIVSQAGSVGAILIEVDEITSEDPEDVEVRGARVDRVIEVARDIFDEGLDLARDCATRVRATIDGLDERLRPDQFELQLAIKLDAQVGAVLTKTGAGAQMQVTMRWVRA